MTTARLSRNTKRAFDVLEPALVLAALARLPAVVSLLVRTKYMSPVLFRQTRPGRQEKPFHLVNFRTIIYAKDEAPNLLPDGERLAPLGRFLRATRLDEVRPRIIGSAQLNERELRSWQQQFNLTVSDADRSRI